ncbi:hypothetical protein CEXT_676961 [Caerostris extrusa]|uniref:Uncharacterized protein n=1 Tax=Caerostris extrusa TaxID=172846 RepID=A0AAV4Q2W1_CAEEX|nr:hypothetical protein CEXT_676961 [Caerostris extrusa]
MGSIWELKHVVVLLGGGGRWWVVLIIGEGEVGELYISEKHVLHNNGESGRNLSCFVVYSKLLYILFVSSMPYCFDTEDVFYQNSKKVLNIFSNTNDY